MWLSLVALAPISAAADLLSRNAFVQQPPLTAKPLYALVFANMTSSSFVG